MASVFASLELQTARDETKIDYAKVPFRRKESPMQPLSHFG
jgi:hypothetical protein